MEVETSEAIGATEDVVVKRSYELQSSNKKAIECQVEANDKDNHDAGYMTSSNDSLHVDVSDDDDNDLWRQSVPPKLSHFNEDDIREMLIEASDTFKKVPEEQRGQWLVDRFNEHYGSVMPTSLIELTASHFFHGDSGISMDAKPNWLDVDKFRRGQKLAVDYQFGLCYADLLSLFTVFSFEDGLKPLILTDASSTPYTAFKRYLSTRSRVQNWYTSDPWTPGTPAYNDIRAVRQMHAMVRKKIQEMSIDEYDEKTKIKNAWCPSLSRARRDFESMCPAPKPGQCPYAATAKFPKLKEYKLSQGEMAATQFAFVGLVILHPKFFGLHDANDEDLEAFCHTWRGLGYLLGIHDDFNFCRGTLGDVQMRCRDFLSYWVKPNLRTVKPEWEHMMRCVVEGMQYYFPGPTYETCLLDFSNVICNMQMSRTYDSLSYSVWFRHKIIRFYFNHGSKFSGFRAHMNRQFNAAVEMARNFDERKHQELKERSAKTLNSYIAQAKRNEISVEHGST